MSTVDYVSDKGTNLVNLLVRNRFLIGGGLALLAVLWGVAIWQGVALNRVITTGFVERSFRAATPIALVAIGGLFAEKSGVFNIGVEGFMIFGAINGLVIAYYASGGGGATQLELWIGVVGAVLISVVLTAIFAVLLIRYKADQIVAGLAVWFLGLGFGPFTVMTVWNNRQTDSMSRIARIQVGEITSFSPFIPITIVITAAAWVFLYRTRYGYWIQAAGENPEALDTAGIDVNRVRYATLIFSGAMAGLGGAVLTLGITGNFLTTGMTTVDGRGWIGIVAYLLGNYHPIGAALAALLFGTADMLQIQLQTVGIPAPATIMGLLPYVIVIVVLALYGKTRMPSHVGEPYESEH